MWKPCGEWDTVSRNEAALETGVSRDFEVT